MGQPLKKYIYTYTPVPSLGFGDDLWSKLTVKEAAIFQGLCYTYLREAAGGGHGSTQEIPFSMGSAAHVMFV